MQKNYRKIKVAQWLKTWALFPLKTCTLFSVDVVQPLTRVWLCDPMDCSMPGFPVFYYLLGFTQTHVYWVGDTIEPSHPLLPPSPPALNLSYHQGLFQWVGYVHILHFKKKDFLMNCQIISNGLKSVPCHLLVMTLNMSLHTSSL